MSKDGSGPSGNAFEANKPGSAERSVAEARIEKLRERGGLFVEAVRATRMPMAVSDPSLPGNPIVFANDAFVKLSGYSMEEVLGQQPHFMNGEETDPQDAVRFREAVEQDRDDVIETIQYRKDRSRFVASVFISAFKNNEGRTLFQFLSYLDVTAWVAAENELLTRTRLEAGLRESEERYRSLFQTMRQGYCDLELVRDESGRAIDQLYLELNPAFEEIVRIPVAQARGRRASEVFPALDPWWTENLDRIAQAGEPERLEHQFAALGRWFEVMVDPRGGDRLTVLYDDITDRKHTEIALRDSEKRQTFLLKFSDALRAERDENGVARQALQLLLGHLQLDRCYVGVYRLEDDIAEFPYQLAREGLPPLPDRIRLSDFPEALRIAFDRTLVIDDGEAADHLSATDRASLRVLGMRALVAATLHEGFHHPLWAIVAVSSSPRKWTHSEIALIEAVTERTWGAIERARADTGRIENEERLRLAIDVGQLASWDWDLRSGAVAWSDRHYLIQGYAPGEVTPSFETWIARVHPDDKDEAIALIENARDTKQVYAHIFRTLRPDGSIRWCSARGRFFYEGETPYRMIGVMEDITDRKLADDSLRGSEERYRLIIASARDYAIFTTDAAGVIDSWPAGAQEVFGWSADEAIGRNIEMTYTPEDVANGEPPKERETARRDGRAPNVRWHLRRDGSRVFIDGVAAPLRAGGEVEGFLKVGRNTTERRALEERQQILVAELQHRTRNLMGLVRAVSEGTMRTSADLADFKQRFRDRLQALSRVQGLLSRLNEHDRVTFDDLIRTELSAIHGQSNQIDLTGPSGVRLRSTTVQTLAMAIHELATNAVKYGALGQPQAKLSVSWALEQATDKPPWLHIDWRESGVVGIAGAGQKRHRGQGTELIEKALPYQLGATTTHVIGEDGVHCIIRIPVSQTMPEADNG